MLRFCPYVYSPLLRGLVMITPGGVASDRTAVFQCDACEVYAVIRTSPELSEAKAFTTHGSGSAMPAVGSVQSAMTTGDPLPSARESPIWLRVSPLTSDASIRNVMTSGVLALATGALMSTC